MNSHQRRILRRAMKRLDKRDSRITEAFQNKLDDLNTAIDILCEMSLWERFRCLLAGENYSRASVEVFYEESLDLSELEEYNYN